jgi:hypothetical protein
LPIGKPGRYDMIKDFAEYNVLIAKTVLTPGVGMVGIL